MIALAAQAVDYDEHVCFLCHWSLTAPRPVVLNRGWRCANCGRWHPEMPAHLAKVERSQRRKATKR